MHQKTADLIARIRELHTQIQGLGAAMTESPASRRLLRRLTAASTAVDAAYQAACVAGSRDRFILHVAAAARHARRERRILQDLTHLHHPSLDATRELILEARGIEAILTASRNTARRRRPARGRA